MILFGLGALTSSQTRLWRDSETLWRNAGARSGASKAHYNLALDRDPKDAKTLLRLGQVLAARGALDKAIQYFRQAAQIQPEDAEFQEGLGRAILELGKRDEAAKHLQEAVRILKSSPVQR